MYHKITLREFYKIIKKKKKTEKGESVNFLPAFNNNDNTNNAKTRGGSFSFPFVCSLNIFPLCPVSFYRLKLKDKGGKRTNNA